MTSSENRALTVSLPITFRLATKHDLPHLEWHGQYRHYRRVFRRTYSDQLAGRRLMLLADCQGMPIGQVFIQLHSGNHHLADGKTRAYLYAIRVMAMFRNRGICTHLLAEAEAIIAHHDYKTMTLAVSKRNLRAQNLYTRLGFSHCGEDAGHWQYTDHKGVIRKVNDPCWILEKPIKLL